jgi:hypothetical protein
MPWVSYYTWWRGGPCFPSGAKDSYVGDISREAKNEEVLNSIFFFFWVHVSSFMFLFLFCALLLLLFVVALLYPTRPGISAMHQSRAERAPNNFDSD